MSASIDFLEGSNAALQNAKRLIACADVVAASGEYGPANSLLILAIEECAKAGFLSACTIAREPLTGDREFVKILRSHKHKHYLGFVTRLMLDIIAEMSNDPSFISSVDDHFKDVDESDAEELLKQAEELIHELISKAMRTAQLAMSQKAAIGDRQWWRDADVRRNQGFYTDWESGSWRTPARIQKTDYEKTRATAQRLLAEFEDNRIKTPEGLAFLRRIISVVYARDNDMVAALPDEL